MDKLSFSIFPFTITLHGEHGVVTRIELKIGERKSDISNTSSPGYLISLKHQILEYIQGKKVEWNVNIALKKGTEFQQRVWTVCQQIPFGEIRSYKWVADKIGKPKAIRAVGYALSKNPFPIVIPCHRIIRKDGKLGGFSCGLEVKRELLMLEGHRILTPSHLRQKIDRECGELV